MKERSFNVRSATLNDLDKIMVIEKECFESPWPKSAIIEELNGNSWSNVCVASDQEIIAGFIFFWVLDIKRHLLNIATSPKWRHQGVGKMMMQHLLDEAINAGAKNVTLEVRESNIVAINLYQNLGFVNLGVHPQYYADNGEDGIIMELQLS